MKVKQVERIEKLKQSLQTRKQRADTTLEKMKLKITIQEETKDYNISTSLEELR